MNFLQSYPGVAPYLMIKAVNYTFPFSKTSL